MRAARLSSFGFTVGTEPRQGFLVRASGIKPLSAILCYVENGLLIPLKPTSRTRPGLRVLLLAIVIAALPVVYVNPATETGGAFERIGPEGGEVRSLLIDRTDPQRVFLGTTDGQLLRSFDGGLSWAPLHPGLGRRQIVIDTLLQHPTEPSRVFAGGWDLRSSGGGLFESADAGNTWREVPLPKRSPAVRDLSICSSRPAYLLVGTLAGAYVSEDGGRNWRQAGGSAAPFHTVESVAIDPVDPNYMYVGTWRLSYRSTDAGKTWRRVEQGMAFDSDVFSIAVSRPRRNVVFASACSGIYRSSDRGATWRKLKPLPDRSTVRAQIVYIDPSQPSWIYGGTTEGLFVSSNEGENWTRVTSDKLTVNAIQVNPKNRMVVLIGTAGHGVLRTDDGGRTWVPSNSGFVHRQVSRVVPDLETGGRVLAGIVGDGDAGGVFVYDRHTSSWSRANAGLDPTLEVLSFLGLPDPLTWAIGTRRGLFVRTGPDNTWKRVQGQLTRRSVTSLAFDSAGKWVFAGTDEGVYRARWGTWNFAIPPASAFRPWIYSLAVTQGSPSVVWAGTSLGILRSNDGGDRWDVLIHGLPERVRVHSIAVSPTNPMHVLAGTPVGLFESTNGGTYWLRVRDMRLSGDIPAVVWLDEGRRVLAADTTGGGFMLSDDRGLTWRSLHEPLFQSPVRDMALDPTDPNLVYVGTNTEGVYRLRVPQAIGSASQ